MTSLFSPDDVISTYSDAQAVGDGVLVDISALSVSFQDVPLNRMTGHLLAALKPCLIDPTEPWDNPLDPDELTPGKLRALVSMLRTKLRYARDTAAAGEQRDYLFELPGGGRDDKIWLIRNEVAGWTVMFASDY